MQQLGEEYTLEEAKEVGPTSKFNFGLLH